MMSSFLILAVLFLLPGCASLQERLPFFGKKEIRVGGVYKENLDADRLVDLTIVKKLTGSRVMGIFPKYTAYLEGYIRGAVVDYEDNPIEGIVVRVVDKGKDLPGYDPGISDTNGVYRIRFSHPLKKGKVDVRGAIAYNPPWQQQLNLLGAALEPQTKETRFRIFYDKGLGIIGIGEDIPKTITRKITGAQSSAAPAKEPKEEKAKKPPQQENRPAAPAAGQKKKDDFFGGFGDFGNE